MGRRHAGHGNTDHGAFPLELLLPLASPKLDEDGDSLSETGGFRHDDPSDTNDTLNLYRQAVPLVHPQSTAAIRTIGTMLQNPQIVQRMLQRQQHIGTWDVPVANGPNVQRRVLFHRTCDDLFFGFDLIATRTGTLPIHRIPLLLRHYALDVDDVRYRQWEQSLSPECRRDVTRRQFIQACSYWFHEQTLIDHYAAWRKSNAHPASTPLLHVHGAIRNSQELLATSQSAPQLLHPFDSLARQNDEARAFSYEDYAHNPPRQRKTQEESSSIKSQAMISATQQLRRKTKTLARLQFTSQLMTAADPAAPSLRQPPLPATHDRLHEEKLARHILERCGTQSLLAPSNRRKSSSLSATAEHHHAPHQSSSPNNKSHTHHHQNNHATAQQRASRKKLMRQQNNETTRAFSASIAMISRHVHNEELRDLREIAHERQVAIVSDRKQLRRLQSAHCKALDQEKSHQQLRDVAAMKTLAEEESNVLRQFLESREQAVRFQKPAFTLSPSTSTLFQQPPEILAAKATAKTIPQKKKLQRMEKEHLDHMRSVQLLDYVYDKKRAVLDAREPKADAALQELELTDEQLPEAQKTALATQELWNQIVESCHGDGDGKDMASLLLLPPPNSPPAALRFFSSQRPTNGATLLPPFTASTVTPNPISKVP